MPKHQTKKNAISWANSRFNVSDTWLCFLRCIVLTVKQNDCVKDKKKKLFEACPSQSDCGECQD